MTTNGTVNSKHDSIALSGVEAAKKRAAYYACEKHIESGYRIGVGTGSTAKYLVDAISEKFHAGILRDIKCVPTSFQVRLRKLLNQQTSYFCSHVI